MLCNLFLLKEVLHECDEAVLLFERVANLQELLEMSTSVLIGFPTEWASLHHGDETGLDLEVRISHIASWSRRDVGSGGSGELAEGLVGHLLRA